ncbi:response regulator rcp1 [mine drainage metagenome]|uniref:Response regulator rcp1 n=1 Tax=mine drainage metagenome TaxID=410659 RepID=A0A1J5SKV2_9ZZZZ
MTASNTPFAVLLVEDDDADAHLTKVALAESRILVDLHRVSDGIEAFDFLRRQSAGFDTAPRPDLILLDLNMPRMDGREFLTRIKQDPALCQIPVVVLTTSDVEQDIERSYHLGAAGFVTKPVDVDQFMKAIGQLNDYWFTLVRLPPKSSP